MEFPGASSTATPAKKAKAATCQERRDVTLDLAKLSLSNAQNARLSRAGYLTIKFPADSPWITTFKAATTAHNTRAEELREQGKQAEEINSEIAIPCVRGINAWVKYYIDQLPEAMDKGPYKKAVEKWHWTVIESPHMAPPHQKPKDAVEDWTPMDFFIEIKKKMLASDKVTQLRGQAPPGDLERKVQEWVNQQEDK